MKRGERVCVKDEYAREREREREREGVKNG